MNGSWMKHKKREDKRDMRQRERERERDYQYLLDVSLTLEYGLDITL
jgi:hypothetical protein